MFDLRTLMTLLSKGVLSPDSQRDHTQKVSEEGRSTMSSEHVSKHESLLSTLQRLLELPATSVSGTLHQSAQLVAAALHAEKVDTFLYDPTSESLVAYGTSQTPMGAKQQALGLDRLPVAQGGRAVHVYQTGESYRSGHVHLDPAELPGMKEDLGIKSEILVPLSTNGSL